MIFSEEEILLQTRAVPAIYKITNLVNGKFYIGGTKNYRIRRVQHFSELRLGKHINPHLQRAFNKYGEHNFKMEMITPAAPDELIIMEQMFLDITNATNPTVGYNACKKAGRPGESLGRHGHSSETRKRISDAKMGQKYSVQARANMSKGQKQLYASGYINPQKGRATPEAIKALQKPVAHFNKQGVLLGEYGSIKKANSATRWSLWLISKSATNNYKLPDGSYWKFKAK